MHLYISFKNTAINSLLVGVYLVFLAETEKRKEGKTGKANHPKGKARARQPQKEDSYIFAIHIQRPSILSKCRQDMKQFIPSSKFDGSKQGYFFGNGDLGIGYYLDKGQSSHDEVQHVINCGYVVILLNISCYYEL